MPTAAKESLVDPWSIAQIIIENTGDLCPLVAVQPVYMHPYTVAKMVTSLAYLYGRRVYLNMVAGGFKNDLLALNDETPHDQRYERLVEYTQIILALLKGKSPVSFDGEYYQVRNLRLKPPLPNGLFPGVFVSGSSTAGLAAAQALNATAIKYPQPVAEYSQNATSNEVDSGIRIGIIARQDEQEAWEVAYQRFPEDRRGQLTHQLAMKTSDSAWHHQLSQLAKESRTGKHPYWLLPFQNYKTFCPYLVGSYQRVAKEIARYLEAGFRTFIMDIPHTEEDLGHINTTFERAEVLQW
jgi:alkanesulfonate monooxygenase